MNRATLRDSTVISIAFLVWCPSVALAGSMRVEAITYREEGYAAQQAGDSASALTWYQKAAEMDATYPTPHNDIGILFEGQGRLKDAERAYRQAIGLNPNYLEAYANLAMLYERMGEDEKAVYCWLKRYQLGNAGDAGTARAKDHLADYGVLDAVSGPILPAVTERLMTSTEPPAEELAEEPPPAEDAWPTETSVPGAARESGEESAHQLIGGFVEINDGAFSTSIPTVSLAVATDGYPAVDARVAQLQVSNDGATFSDPKPFEAVMPWVLSEGDGFKTVSVRLLDAAGQTLATLEDAIFFDASPLMIRVASHPQQEAPTDSSAALDPTPLTEGSLEEFDTETYE